MPVELLGEQAQADGKICVEQCLHVPLERRVGVAPTRRINSAAHNGGYRLLADNFYGVEQPVVAPKGNKARSISSTASSTRQSAPASSRGQWMKPVPSGSTWLRGTANRVTLVWLCVEKSGLAWAASGVSSRAL